MWLQKLKSWFINANDWFLVKTNSVAHFQLSWKSRSPIRVKLIDNLFSSHSLLDWICMKQVYGPEASMTGICKSAIDYISVSAWCLNQKKHLHGSWPKIRQECFSPGGSLIWELWVCWTVKVVYHLSVLTSSYEHRYLHHSSQLC
jgi:hypothetical protein